MKFLSDLLVQGDGNEIFLKSADHNISRIIPRGTGANLDKGLFSLYDTGTEDVRIDTAGNSWFNGGQVGIGTTSPARKLHVSEAGNGNIALFTNTTDADLNINLTSGVTMLTPSTALLAFGTSSSEKMRIIGNGNVGIGTTSPREKLDVDGDIVTTWGNDKFVGLQYQQGAAYQNGLLLHGDNRSTGLIAKGGTGSTPYIWFGVSEGGNTERMRITKDGNVGIGTTSPSNKLTVEDVIGVKRAGVNAISTIQQTSSGLEVNAPDGYHPLIIKHNGTEYARFKNNGNVGIGTTSPESKLNIEAAAESAIPALGANTTFLKISNSGGEYGTMIGQLSTGDGYIQSQRFDGGNSVYNLLLQKNGGNVGIGTASPNAKLDVAGNTRLGSGTLHVSTDQTFGTGFTYSFRDAVGILNPNGTSAASATAVMSIGGMSNGYSLVTTGNVGIGTAAPSQKLHVAGKGLFTDFVRFNGVTAPDFPVDIDAVDGGKSLRSTRGTSVFRIDQGNDGPGYIGMQSADDFSIQTNNTSKIYITSAGNVGIGTTSPGNTLHVYKNATIGVISSPTVANAGLRIQDSGANMYVDGNSFVISTAGYLTTTGSNDFDIGTNSTSRIKIKGGGSVGIGTTNPNKRLSVETNDTATYSASVNASEISIARKNSSNTAGQVAAISLNATGWSGSTTGVVVLNAIARQGNFSNADFAIQNRVGGSFVETFRITTYGNVGIGTDTPDDNVNTGNYFKPDSGGRFLTAKDSSGSFIMLESSTTTDNDQIGGIYFNNTGGQTDAHVHVAGIDAILHKNSTNDALSGGDLRFFTKPSGSGVNGPRMVILENGNVGIGTTAPSEKLHVSGNLRVTGAFVDSSASAGSAGTVLSSTNTGTAWVGASGLPGGPYLPLAGGTMTGTSGVIFPDAFKLNLGTGSDLEIYHNGLSGNNNIDNINGDLYMSQYANDKDIIFRSDDGSGGVATYFYLDGSSAITRVAKNFRTDDNAKLQLGSAGDASLYHNGTNTVFINDTGHLIFENRSDDKDIYFKSDDNSGGVTTYFYLDGGLKKTQFWQSTRHIDNVYATFGTSDDLQIYHDGSNSYITDTGTGDLYLTASDNVYFQTYGSGKRWITLNENASVDLFYNDSKKFETTSTGVAVTGKITNLTAGTGNLDAVNVQQLNNATTGTLIYKGTWSAAPTTTSVLDGAVSSAGTIVIDAVNPGISVGATITGTGISGTVTVSNIAADGITIAISSSQTIADGTTLTFTTVGGTPDLSQASRKVTGHYYICETAGAVTPNGAGTTPNEWAVGDWATFSDLTTDAWQKIDNSSVLSGAGTGGKVPVWSGTGTSVTLADAPITVSGNHSSFTGDVLPLVNGGSNLGSNSKQWGSIYAGGIGASTVTLTTIKLNGSFSILNKAQNAYIGFATRNTSGSQTVMDLTNVGSATFAGKINAKGGANVSGFTAATINAYTATVSSNLYSALRIVDNTAASTYWDIGAVGGASPDLKFFVNAGTTPKFTLSAAGNATFAGAVTTGGELTFSNNNTGVTMKDAAGTNTRVFRLNSGNTMYVGPIDSYAGGEIFYGVASQVTGHKFHVGAAAKLTIDSSGNSTFAGNVELGDSSNISMSNAAPGQLQIQGSGYTGAIALNATAMYIYHNSSLRDLVLGTNETARLTIDGSNGNATFAGDVTVGGKAYPKINLSDNQGVARNFSVGTSNETFTVRNETGSVDVFTIAGTGNAATFAGNVTLNGDGKLLKFTPTSYDDVELGVDSNGFVIYNTTDSRYDLKISGTGNATFGGDVSLPDNKKLILGAGDDLQIFHNGTASIIKDAGAGNLQINASDFVVNNAADTKNMIIAVDGGATTLFCNGAGKIATTSTGVSVTGNGIFTGNVNTTLVYGTTDLNLGYAGGTSGVFIKGSTALAGNVGIGTTAPKSKLQVAGGIQMAGDTAAASADKVGTMRYRTGTEYVEVNGVELIVNGDFAADSNWTKGTGWTISGGKANCNSGSSTELYQSLAVSGKTYKITFTITSYTSGNIAARAGGVTGVVRTSTGTFTDTIVANGTQLGVFNSGGFVGSIDNVSVIEVTAEDASYADMCMQTGSSTYEWVNIVRNTY